MKHLGNIGKAPLRKLLDGIWTAVVKADKTHCEICGEPSDNLNAHHLLSRIFLAYRWEPLNVAILCPLCHRLGRKSIHTAPHLYYGYDTMRVLFGSPRAKWFEANKNKLDSSAPSLKALRKYYMDLDRLYRDSYGKPYRSAIAY